MRETDNTKMKLSTTNITRRKWEKTCVLLPTVTRLREHLTCTILRSSLRTMCCICWAMSAGSPGSCLRCSTGATCLSPLVLWLLLTVWVGVLSWGKGRVRFKSFFPLGWLWPSFLGWLLLLPDAFVLLQYNGKYRLQSHVQIPLQYQS